MRPALPCVHIHEVIVKTVHVGHLLVDELQRVANPRDDVRSLGVTVGISDAQRGQAKAGRGNTGHRAGVVAVQKRTVFHLSSGGIGLIPEKLKGTSLQIIQQLRVSSLEWHATGILRALRATVTTQ